MKQDRRQFLAGTLALGLAAPSSSTGQRSVTPEMFGAKGDGRTNDTEAFLRMSAAVNRAGGGVIVLRPVTYIVGKQTPAVKGQHWLTGADAIHLVRCSDSIEIIGNGAVLRAAPGLRYGRFDQNSQEPLPDAVALERTGTAVPYQGMIHVEDCSGPITIGDLELDGNLKQMIVGGKNAKSGWEAGGTGVRLRGNSNSERVTRVRSHHHPQDGLIINPASNRRGSTVVTDVDCDSNGRQGCSIFGGHGIRFVRCKFRRTGKGGLAHAPGTGVDIEAERPPLRDIMFTECEFSDNHAAAAGADMGNSAGILFSGCRLIGTTAWSAWPKKPDMRFEDCLFVGALTHIYGDADPQHAARFDRCTFTDDPSLSPTGQVFLGRVGEATIAWIGQAQNVRFSGCRFRMVADGLLPRSGPSTVYENCHMSQRSPVRAAPRGTYTGTGSITGNVDLSGSIIDGVLTKNGTPLARGVQR